MSEAPAAPSGRASVQGARPTAPSRPRTPHPPVVFIPPADARLDVLWTQGAHTRVLRLVWRSTAAGYQLRLDTPDGAAGRAASWQRSEGTWSTRAGLAPRRYTAKRPGQSEQAISFLWDEPDRPMAAYSATTFRQWLRDGTQDALSWLPHWLGRLQATGKSAPFELTHPDGRIVPVHFVQDPEDPRHWRSVPETADAEVVDVWFGTTPGEGWPLRWRQVSPWGGVSEWTLMHQQGADDAPRGP